MHYNVLNRNTSQSLIEGHLSHSAAGGLFYVYRKGVDGLGLLEKAKNLFRNPETSYNEDLALFVNNEYTRRQTERKPWELQWRLNAEFLNGNQYLDINPVSLTVEEIPKLYWYQEREVFNQIATITETRIARLTRQMPMLKTRPASNEDKDLSTSVISSALLDSSWNDQSMPEKYTDFVSWLELTGTVFWKPSWSVQGGKLIYKGMQPDPNADKRQRTDEDQGMTDELAQKLGRDQQMVEIREGDIETCVVSSHEIYPDSCYRAGLKQCRSLIHARAYHVLEIEEMYGQIVEPETVDVMTMQQNRSALGGLGYSFGSFRLVNSKLENHAVVKEFYERPSIKYPAGRFIVVAGKKTLYVGPLPYMIGEDDEPDFPFVRTVCINDPGCFWGKTIIERCIPIQRRYNALRNRKAEYLNTVTIGQWYEPEGTIDDDTELNNAPGNRIRYRPNGNGAKPEPVQFPSLPGSFENEIQTLNAEFTSISGVSELSRFSEAPSGVKSGKALGIATEQDDTRVSTTAQRIANSTVQLGKYWLRLYRQFVKQPRMLRSLGANREVEVREWYVSDLKSDDVFIENSAALAESPAQRREMVFQLINLGLFARPEMNQFDQEARQKIFQLLEYGHWESGIENDYYLQRSRAKRECDKMKQNILPQVMDYDDDQIHIQQHNRERMTADYEQMMQTPEGQAYDQLMRQHVAMHYQAIMAKMPQVAPQAPPGQDGAPQEAQPTNQP